MSVLIKGMEMPVNCWECPLYDKMGDEYGLCLAITIGKYGCKEINVKPSYDMVKPEWCPIVEIPTSHGDLIDRDNMQLIVKSEEWYGERRKGEWLNTTHGLKCSVCDTLQTYASRYFNYCPICGARMVEE